MRMNKLRQQKQFVDVPHDWAETGLVRTMTVEHEGDVECTQTSAHVNSGLMLTDSIGVSSSKSNTA